MYLMLGIVLAGLVCLGDAWGRDTTKTFRSLPTISNSLVNLGKMDISFHFNAKDLPSTVMKSDQMHSMNPYFNTKSAEMEQCPCSSLKSFKNPFLTNPSDILNKILKSNDLFSHNQDHVLSASCCDSHEHVQEEAVFFDFNPRVQPESASFQTSFRNPAQFPFKDIFPPRASFSAATTKPNAIEIFFFPKNKNGFNSVFELPKLNKKKDFVKKTDIQVVGDKELKNEFKDYTVRTTKADVKDEVQDKVKSGLVNISENLTKTPSGPTQSPNSL